MEETPWLVVFTDLEPLPADVTRVERVVYWLLRRVYAPGFRHVFAVRLLDGGKRFVIVNPYLNVLDVLILGVDEPIQGTVLSVGLWWEWLCDAVARGLPAVVVSPVRATSSPRVRLRLPTCVGIIKHLLGIGGFAVTPKQLYRCINRS